MFFFILHFTSTKMVSFRFKHLNSVYLHHYMLVYHLISVHISSHNLSLAQCQPTSDCILNMVSRHNYMYHRGPTSLGLIKPS